MMLKLLCGLLVFALVPFADASLVMGGSVNDKVDFGNTSSLNNIDPVTVMMWIYPTAKSANRFIISKGVAVSNNRRSFFVRNDGTTGNIAFIADRSVSDLTYMTTDTPFATSNKWYFFAYTFDSGASAGNIVNFYTGDLRTPASPRAYSAADGSGTFQSDASASLLVGQTSAGSLSFQGRVAYVQIVSGVLTQSQIVRYQFSPVVLSGSRLFTQFGYHGVLAQTDWSGNGNSGTVTTAKRDQHVPVYTRFLR